MHLAPLSIDSNLRTYQVHFKKDVSFVTQLASISPAVFVIDQQVWSLYKDTALRALAPQQLILFQAIEENKNLESCCALYEKIMSFSPRKNLTLVSIGGGITQDVTGFVASTLYRGIHWKFIPTTLLAQVDSCIGAKTSLNFKHYKNLLGSFFPPEEIVIWTDFIQTLTEEDYYCGIGEMAKLHLMDGPSSTAAFVQALPALAARQSDVLLARTKTCLNIKKSYIEKDEFDTGKRNMLNYGHCFGHAIESACRFAIPHGQAVVLGMLLANVYAKEHGLLAATQEVQIRTQVLRPILKCIDKLPLIQPEQALQAMGQDKKRTGTGLALVMLTDDGMKKITNLSQEDALSLLKRIREIVS